jgi:hypothetical protein
MVLPRWRSGCLVPERFSVVASASIVALPLFDMERSIFCLDDRRGS